MKSQLAFNLSIMFIVQHSEKGHGENLDYEYFEINENKLL